MNTQHILLALCCTIAMPRSIAQTPDLRTKAPLATPAQQLIINTGEDSMNNYGSTKSATVVSGYGEIHYQHDANAGQSTTDLKRGVIFIGHQFTGKIAFFSELEVENAKIEAGGPTGEVGMEQLYLKFSLNPRQYIVAGLFLPRIGIVNENHLPINFNGVERPLVEQMVIPSTWREIGVGYYSQLSGTPLSYSLAVVNGLNNAGFEHGTGFEGGRQEGQNASANNIAITASAQYYLGNWKFQLSGYYGGTTPLSAKAADSLHLSGGLFGTPLMLTEADVQYSNKGISFKALGCNVSIPDAAKINAAYYNNTPSQMYGVYAELGYNLLENIKKEYWHRKTLNLFARYEVLDMNAATPGNGEPDGTMKQSHLIAGLGYFPIPHVVIKADVRLMHTGDTNPNLSTEVIRNNNHFINIGIGYSF